MSEVRSPGNRDDFPLGWSRVEAKLGIVGITKFEEIRAWQEARVLVNEIYQLTARPPLLRGFGLRDQLQRSAVSAMGKVAEGFDCDSHREFARFLGIARRSVVEVQSLLYVLGDVGYISQPTFKEVFQQAEKVKRLVGALKRSLIT